MGQMDWREEGTQLTIIFQIWCLGSSWQDSPITEDHLGHTHKSLAPLLQGGVTPQCNL